MAKQIETLQETEVITIIQALSNYKDIEGLTESSKIYTEALLKKRIQIHLEIGLNSSNIFGSMKKNIKVLIVNHSAHILKTECACSGKKTN